MKNHSASLIDWFNKNKDLLGHEAIYTSAMNEGMTLPAIFIFRNESEVNRIAVKANSYERTYQIIYIAKDDEPNKNYLYEQLEVTFAELLQYVPVLNTENQYLRLINSINAITIDQTLRITATFAEYTTAGFDLGGEIAEELDLDVIVRVVEEIEEI